MAVTYYVALPFIRTDDGTAPGGAVVLKKFGDVPEDLSAL